MITKILKKLGVKIVIFRLSHEVLNATANIGGVLKDIESGRRFKKGHLDSIRDQLCRIESAMCYVRKINKGDV
jgi:hypothetical protein